MHSTRARRFGGVTQKGRIVENLPIKAGESVRFVVGKVICPGLDKLCEQIDSDLEIEGQVAFLSDYGRLREHFAIVQVKGIHVPLIVPVENLRLIERNGRAAKRMMISKDRLVG